MGILSLISGITRILDFFHVTANPLDPFTLEFTTTILYLPTIVLAIVASVKDRIVGALIIMAALSILTLATRLVGLDPFVLDRGIPIYESMMFYAPTLVLFAAAILRNRRRAVSGI